MSRITAELLVVRKRRSAWVLLAVWVALGAMFGYLLPYLTLSGANIPQQALVGMLPENLTDNVLGGFPVFGGVIALIVGVLAIGSDYGWDTLKTILTQRSGRVRMLGAKLAALAITLLVFAGAMFAAGAAASFLIATTESAPVSWQSPAELGLALGAGWFVLAIWAALGVMLAVLSRGTALAIGLGVLYGLAVETLLSAIAGQVSFLQSAAEYSLRANAYSLVAALGVPAQALTNNGPGGFSGPFVGTGHALTVLTSYLVVGVAVAAATLSRRDVA
jgi:ABC-type transport system involved in multi-copper enzyme maturation permease subunit